MATQATINKQCNTLISQFIKLYTDKHKREPQINRYKQKWGFQDMISDLGFERSQEVLEYFFGLKKPEHSVQTLLHNYDRYAETLKNLAEDREERHRLRALTEKKVKEMEENGNDGSGSP